MVWTECETSHREVPVDLKVDQSLVLLWLLKNKDLGRELDLAQVLLQVSMFEKTLLHDIIKAARGAAVSRCAASNHSQMLRLPLCIAQTPRGARTGLLTGNTAALAVSLSCSDLLRVLWAAAVRNNGAEMITQMLNLTANVKPGFSEVPAR